MIPPVWRSHDVPWLTERWRRVARAARLTVRELAQTALGPVLLLEGEGREGPGLYASSGVHGDEAAAAAGLLSWAEESISVLRRRPVLLVPVFNPEGLAVNTRADGRGRDLNRRFHLRDPLMRAWRAALRGRHWPVAVCLHEDYDAAGCYCYELNRDPALRLGAQLLPAVEPWLPLDLRRRIDGRPAKRGVIRRRRVPDLPGLPEAIALYEAAADVTLTFETPSECDFGRRVEAHVAFLRATAAWLWPET